MPPWAAQSSLSKWTNIASCALSCCMTILSETSEAAAQVAGRQQTKQGTDEAALASGVGEPEQFRTKSEARLGDRLRTAVLVDAIGAAEPGPDAGLLPAGMRHWK